MIPFQRNIFLFYALFALSLVFLAGSFVSDFPTINMVLINLIFISLLFQNPKATLFTGILTAVLYSLIWFTPVLSPEKPESISVYLVTMFLIVLCTTISLILLESNTRSSQGLKHFYLLYEYATEGIVIVDERGRILMANPTLCKMFGYREKELSGKTIEMLIPVQMRGNHPGYRMKYSENPGTRRMGEGRELLGLRKNNEEFPVEISLSYYTEKKQTFVIAFIIDITIRKQSERTILDNSRSLEKLSSELKILNEQLEKKVEERTADLTQSQIELKDALNKEKELNEIKSRFVSMASHEFRTPLSTILSSSSLIQKYRNEDQQSNREKHIERIKDSVRHLNSLLEDFLSMGKLEENKVLVSYENCNIRNLFYQVFEEMEVLKKPGQKIECSYHAREHGETDKLLLKGILVNLIGNAIKFSPENESILLSCSEMDGKLMVKVADKGIGIPAEDMDKLFGTFFRSKNAFNIQGTGLGLHIVKRYIDLLNGTIEIKSELNKGTTAIITIPY